MDLITLTDPRSPVAEAYRTLRTNLSFYGLDQPIHSLVLTSPAAGEGTAETVANLAITMAQSGKRTVLVDCDLRRPQLHALFGLPGQPGLTNYMLEDLAELPLQATGVDDLWLLASGPTPPNPADLLGTSKMDEVIALLLQRADMVLFDAPPVAAFTDAAILGSKVDGVLLVIEAGKTRRDHAERAKELLAKAKVRLIGATLTNAPKDSAVDDYYA